MKRLVLAARFAGRLNVEYSRRYASRAIGIFPLRGKAVPKQFLEPARGSIFSSTPGLSRIPAKGL